MHAGQRQYVTSAPAANGGPYRRCAVWNRISIQVWLSISGSFQRSCVASPSYNRNDSSRASNLRQCLGTARHRLNERTSRTGWQQSRAAHLKVLPDDERRLRSSAASLRWKVVVRGIGSRVDRRVIIIHPMTTWTS
ncbi:hypothetical protein GFL88_00135 [Rhizobium leguminosarum bv. viciae]|nr:hypothetical protein [Rhizobium leguminosarum bv. viciae]